MTKSASDIDARLDLFDTLKAEARGVTLPLYNGDMQVTNKAARGFDPVTNADTQAEQALRRLIQDAFPDDHIEGEEFDDVVGSNDWLWTLDPIDGTRAFVAGVPVWGTLIALSRAGKPVIGLADFPALNVSSMGTPDGTFRTYDNGDVTKVSAKSCGTISEAILGCTEPLSMLSPSGLAAYNIIRKEAAFSRLGLDSYGYALVASGRMDIIIEADLKPCDVRALIPIVEGAGGRVTDWQGGSAVDGGQVVAVGDANLLPELYKHLGSAIDE